MKNRYLFGILIVFVSIMCIAIFDGYNIKVHGLYRYKQGESDPEIIDIKRKINQLLLEQRNLEKRLSNTQIMTLKHMKLRVRLFAIPYEIKQLEKRIQRLSLQAIEHKLIKNNTTEKYVTIVKKLSNKTQ